MKRKLKNFFIVMFLLVTSFFLTEGIEKGDLEDECNEGDVLVVSGKVWECIDNETVGRDVNGTDLNLNNLIVKNISVEGHYFNVSVIDYNVTGNMIVEGNITADYFKGDGSLLTGINGDNATWNESHATDLYVDETGDTMTGDLKVDGQGSFGGSDPNVTLGSPTYAIDAYGRFQLQELNYVTYMGSLAGAGLYTTDGVNIAYLAGNGYGLNINGESYIDGNLTIQNGDIHILGDNQRLYLGASDDASLYFDGTSTFHQQAIGFMHTVTSSSGYRVHRNAAGDSVFRLTNTGGRDWAMGVSYTNDEYVISNGAFASTDQRFAVGATNVRIPNNNSKLLFGDEDSSSIYYNTDNMVINPRESDGGNLVIEGDVVINDSNVAELEISSNTANIPQWFLSRTGGYGVIGRNNGANFELLLGNVIPTAVKFRVLNTGNVELPNDNQKLTFGASDDDAIYHDATDLVIAPGSHKIKLGDGQSYIQDGGRLSSLYLLELRRGSNPSLITQGSVQMDADNYGLDVGEAQDTRIIFDGKNLIIDSNDITVRDNLTVTDFDKVDIEGDLEFTGNLTGNIFYAEMWGNELSGNLVLEDVYYNITDYNGTKLNGFYYHNGSLNPLVAGTYQITSQYAFSGTANNEYHLTIGVNGTKQDNCHTERVIGTGGDVGSASITCLLQLSINSNVTIMIENVDSAGNPLIHDININLFRLAR